MNPGGLAFTAFLPDEFVSIVSPMAMVGKVCSVLCRKKSYLTGTGNAYRPTPRRSACPNDNGIHRRFRG